MKQKHRSLVIIPTYNEAENIQPLLTKVIQFPVDVLIIDDNSPDQTAEQVLKLKSSLDTESHRIHLIQRSGKLGLGTAYLKGFQWALERDYENILQMDADFSHDPQDIPRFLEASKSSDLVLGTRYIPGGGIEGWSWFRNFLSRSANLYARLALGIPLHDLTGGFKCYCRKALASLDLTKIHSEGYAFQIETTAKVFKKGFSIKEIPIFFQDRTRGKSKLSRRIIWEAFWLVIRLAIRFRLN